jgi:hypothetical protein
MKSLTINHNKQLIHINLNNKLYHRFKNTCDINLNVVNSNHNYDSCKNPLDCIWFERFSFLISEIEFYYGTLSNKNKKRITNWLELIILEYI